MSRPYNDLSTFLRARLGHKTAKICIDGGFTCPNRDGRLGTGGCLFCGARGAGDFTISDADITAQVRARLAAPLGGRRAERFIAYFQNFSGTYADVAALRARYDAALCDGRIVGLAVATRPDCITKEVVDLLVTYAERMYVWVELGLQTAREETAAAMRMGYTGADFLRAATLLANAGIDVVAHMIVGLPGEGRAEAMNTLRFINSAPVKGIKIHSLYVMEGSGLADLWREGRYTPLTFEEYTQAAVELLCHARPDLVIHRLTGDCPKNELLAPLWSAEKNKVLDEIHRLLRVGGLYQGCLYEKSNSKEMR